MSGYSALHKDSISSEVKRHDFERYLATLYFPKEMRPKLHFIVAFNLEIARIHEITSEPLVAHMRLAWWKEVIAEIYAGNCTRKHPVVEGLKQIAPGLSRMQFDAILEARVMDFAEEPLVDMEAFEEYACGTAASLFHLWAEIAGIEEKHEAIDHLGIAWAITGLLRAARFSSTAERLAFPQSLRIAHKAEAGGFLELEPGRAMVRTMASTARDHLKWYKQERTDNLRLFDGAAAILDYSLVHIFNGKGDIFKVPKSLRLALLWRMLLS